MSKRHLVGDIVTLTADNFGQGEGRRVILRDGGTVKNFHDAVPRCGDKHCREWIVLELIDKVDRPTGRFLYHFDECQMVED